MGCSDRAAFLAVLAVSPVWVFLTHIVLARLVRRTSPQLLAAAACVAGAIPVALLCLMLFMPGPRSGPEVAIQAAFGFIVYSCLAYSYFHWFNMTETARRIRILVELYAAGTLTGPEISSRYAGVQLLETRFERLVATHQLEVRSGRYVRGTRLLYALARMTRAWRSILGFDRGSVRPPDA